MTRNIWLITSSVRECPYCGGKLYRSKTGLYNFDCGKCDRAWKIDENGDWHALYDAAKTICIKEEIFKRFIKPRLTVRGFE
jgi:hypothetical protein